ncbi:MAG: hypothetical protein QOI62_276 [Solirubrobacteraceae bacterium]|jgi:DNA-binding NarL/FixJ family response regulator|nr:hypothetical protein [Solirubrobacteraceae bacterium]
MATVESASRIRVVAADLQPLFRESIARVVRECPDLELVGEALEDARSSRCCAR